MFKSKTVFIVGAGASAEFNFPQGTVFKDKISEKIDIKFEDGYNQSSGDRNITLALREHVKQNREDNNINQYLQLAWEISNAMSIASSIDSYVELHNNNKKIELISKLGIVSTILEAENKSRLYFTPETKNNFNLRKVNHAWLAKFFQILVQGVTIKNLDNIFDNVSFICFNYDRCIELFLSIALQTLYSISEQDSQDLLKKLEIIHPYGTVGALPWQSDINKVGFGELISGKRLLEQTKKIKTFSEQLEEKNDLENIRNEIANAENLVFLGMHYHEQNIRLLTPNAETRTKRIFGTAFGISDSDLPYIESELISMVNQVKTPNNIRNNIYLKNSLKASELFDEYYKSLRA